MKKYARWVIFGLVAIGLIVLLVLIGANKKLRQRIEALLLERFVKNKVRDLQDKAAHTEAQAEAGKIKAEEAEKVARETGEAISKQKKDLQKKYESQGINADEISNRFNNLDI